MVYVSFCTKGIYQKIINTYLIPSLKKFNLNYDIDCFENKGSWIDNIQYKPLFIKKALLKHKCPIISLDADATIEKKPTLFQSLKNYDIAIHYLDWKTWYGHGNKKELLGGTMYFNYNKKVLNLIEKWIKEQEKSKQFAQRVFQKLLENEKDLKIYNLPLEYCYIKTRPGNKSPLIKLDPIILQHQTSRKYKKGE